MDDIMKILYTVGGLGHESLIFSKRSSRAYLLLQKQAVEAIPPRP
jgi:hypothetical protein